VAAAGLDGRLDREDHGAVTADPKPSRRVVDPAAGQAKLAYERVCRACASSRRERAWWYRLQRHHLVPRSLGGDDVADNIVPLCLPCHQDFESSPSLRREVAQRVRASLTLAELAYVLAKKSRAWLDRYYPPPPKSAS
jgi:5-methylcytosine-specific restriction endonuclease McrA